MPSNPPHRSILARLLLALGIAGLTVFGLWRLTRDDSPPPPPETPIEGSPAGSATPAEGLNPSAAPPTSQDATVRVTACTGVALGDLTVVVQGASRAWQAPVKEAEGRAEARIAGAGAPGPKTVSVSWGDWSSEPNAMDGDKVLLDVCPGAEIYGRVMTGQAAPREGAPVELHDRQGRVIARAVTDGKGAYSLRDPGLTGASLAIPTLEAPEVGRRLIVQLKPLEKREIHVLVGETRPIVGWVLDAKGDPQAGVLVSLDWEGLQTAGAPANWTALTDGGGAFTFMDAPPGPVRVRADGGVQGQASARVSAVSGPGGRPRREVTLVLEPSASLRVTMPVAPPGAVVVVRSHDPLAHGGVAGLDTDKPGQSSSLVSLDFMKRTLVPALEKWNDGDVETSMTTVALAMMSPSRALTLPLRYRDAYPEVSDDAKDPAAISLDGAARAAARRAITDHPDTVSYFGRAARRLRGGMDARSALGMPFGTGSAGPDALVAQYQSPYAAEAPAVLSAETRAVLLRAFGDGVPVGSFVVPGESWAEVTHGEVGDWLAVQAGIVLQVSVRLPGIAAEVRCGDALVGAAGMFELPCGLKGEAVIRGRVLDVNEEPLVAAELRFEGGPKGKTGAGGYFEVKWNIERGAAVDLWSCTDCGGLEVRGLVGARRSINVVPGRTTDIGDLVLGPQAPLTGSQGEVAAGGGTFLPTLGGFFIDSVDEGGWLENEGVSPGDSLVRMGTVEAAGVGRDELFRILGGAKKGASPHDDLPLWLKTIDGELYPVTLGPRKSKLK